MIYLLDASVLITAHTTYYPIDRVPEFWDWLQHQARLGKIKVPQEIFEEIKDGPEEEGRDLLFDWITSEEVKNDLLLAEEADPVLVAQVVNDGYANNLSDSEIEQIGRDPFLISYALSDRHNRCVVTTEVSKPSKQRQNKHIPDVCQGFGLTCINTFSLSRELNFSTAWRAAP
ncbi:DUF4411 family protein [Lysobacter sp. CFH 32150]|uniref:DUF4411 family protein n=1 Tax=Lysobacter sp. CFH 32150 TaxID=2927128 RepID=UPI001FA6D8A6|nr:DUF4411 family protein [Lysobacter sp. CFH 32150]